MIIDRFQGSVISTPERVSSLIDCDRNLLETSGERLEGCIGQAYR